MNLIMNAPRVQHGDDWMDVLKVYTQQVVDHINGGHDQGHILGRVFRNLHVSSHWVGELVRCEGWAMCDQSARVEWVATDSVRVAVAVAVVIATAVGAMAIVVPIMIPLVRRLARMMRLR